MWSILPYDIIAQIIDSVGEDKDTKPLKELALVFRSFHQICCKYLFATVELLRLIRNARSHLQRNHSSGRRRPEVVKHIRKLTYEVGLYTNNSNNDDFLLSHILPKFFRTISRLNCLTIRGSMLYWHTLDSSLTSALLYLMHLPTIIHIDLSNVENFPLSSLTPSVNLLRLYISNVDPLEVEIVIQSEMMPKIREFNTSNSSELTIKLLHAKRQDRRPAFNFVDLRRLSTCHEDKRNVWHLLQNAKLLEKLHLTLGYNQSRDLVGLHDILFASEGTLKVLDLTLIDLQFEWLCEELEAMAGHIMLEALSLEVKVTRDETADYIGSIIQNVEKVLVKPGWSALRQVSFKVLVACCLEKENSVELAFKTRVCCS